MTAQERSGRPKCPACGRGLVTAFTRDPYPDGVPGGSHRVGCSACGMVTVAFGSAPIAVDTWLNFVLSVARRDGGEAGPDRCPACGGELAAAVAHDAVFTRGRPGTIVLHCPGCAMTSLGAASKAGAKQVWADFAAKVGQP